jgi:hypothetical protein
VRTAWRAAGIVPLPLAVSPAGVVVEETDAREAALG